MAEARVYAIYKKNKIKYFVLSFYFQQKPFSERLKNFSLKIRIL